jgi:hypothetical protein
MPETTATSNSAESEQTATRREMRDSPVPHLSAKVSWEQFVLRGTEEQITVSFLFTSWNASATPFLPLMFIYPNFNVAPPPLSHCQKHNRNLLRPSPAQSFWFSGPVAIHDHISVLLAHLCVFKMGPPLRREAESWLLLTDAVWDCIIARIALGKFQDRILGLVAPFILWSGNL